MWINRKKNSTMTRILIIFLYVKIYTTCLFTTFKLKHDFRLHTYMHMWYSDEYTLPWYLPRFFFLFLFLLKGWVLVRRKKNYVDHKTEQKDDEWWNKSSIQNYSESNNIFNNYILFPIIFFLFSLCFFINFLFCFYFIFCLYRSLSIILLNSTFNSQHHFIFAIFVFFYLV